MDINKENVGILKRIWRKYIQWYRKIDSNIRGQLREDVLDGRFGKHILIYYYLKKFSFWNPPSIEAKKLLSECNEKYDEIRPHFIDPNIFIRIGEVVPRYNLLMNDFEKNKENRILDIVSICKCEKVCNVRMLNIMRRNCIMINDGESRDWLYVLKHFKNVNFKYIRKFQNRAENDMVLNPKENSIYWKLLDGEISEGEDKLRSMGISEDFVCFSNRDSLYLKENIGDWFEYHNYRNSNIETRNKAVKYLLKQHINCVRMGKNVSDKNSVLGMIDYATEYYDEFMDIFLASRCKFFVNDPSGVDSFAFSYGIPQIFTNDVAILGSENCGLGGFPQRKDSILLFKKIWNFAEKRYLTFDEILEAQYYINGDGRKADELKLSFIENTDEEILDAVVEMNERLDGSDVASDDEELIQRLIGEKISKHLEKYHIIQKNRYVGRIGSKFILKNRELLDL